MTDVFLGRCPHVHARKGRCLQWGAHTLHTYTRTRPRARRGWRKARALVVHETAVCEAATLVPDVACAGLLHAHHLLRRSQGGTDLPDNLAAVCTSHHDWIHAHPARAVTLGLLRRSGQ